MAQAWFVKRADRIDGPFTPKDLRLMASNGQLAPEDGVSQDQQSWHKAAQLKGLPFVMTEGNSPAQSGPLSTATGSGASSQASFQIAPSTTGAAAAAKPAAPPVVPDPYASTAASSQVPPPAAAAASQSGATSTSKAEATPSPAAASLINATTEELVPEAMFGDTQSPSTTPSMPRQPAASDPIQADIKRMLDDPDEAIPGYEIIDVIGRGGMGVVFRARQKKLDRLVAIKTMLVSQVQNPKALARFEKEAQTIAKLRHLNIVTAHDFGQHDGRFYLVMELLAGENLEGVLERQGALPEATVWGLIRQAASGLQHATHMGVVHRDIKPANLILVEPPAGLTLPHGMKMVKVTDFGVALLSTDVGESDARLTNENTSMGTPLYMAPEQSYTSDVDHRADIYALGGTAYHLLSGKPPFEGQNAMQIMLTKMKASPPSIREQRPELCPETDELLADMLNPDPEQRIRSYEMLLSRIESLPSLLDVAIAPSIGPIRSTPTAAFSASSTPKSGVQTSVDAPAVAEPARPVATHRRGIVIGAAVLAIVAICATLVMFFGSGPKLPDQPLKLPTRYTQPLFTGVNIDEWRLVNGSWAADQDVEGGQVLEGRGVIRRTFPPLSNYRLSMGVDPREASLIEFEFGIASAPSPQQQSRYAIRLTPTGAQLIYKASEGGKAEPRSPGLPRPSVAEMQNRSPYLELRIERQGDVWWAFFDGKTLGAVPVQSGGEQQEFRLIVAPSEAAFESIEVMELVMPAG